MQALRRGWYLGEEGFKNRFHKLLEGPVKVKLRAGKVKVARPFGIVAREGRKESWQKEQGDWDCPWIRERWLVFGRTINGRFC